MLPGVLIISPRLVPSQKMKPVSNSPSARASV